MNCFVRRFASFAIALSVSAPVAAQQRTGVMGELVRDVATVEEKIVGLARSLPAETFGWRPAKGVRSIGDVLLHVAGDNYFLPALMGAAAPPETAIDAADNKSVARFESRTLTRGQIIAELEKSFAFLKQAMNDTPDSALESRPKHSVRNITTRGLWIAALSHLHEHLGQLIAYARSNNVTPPWSK